MVDILLFAMVIASAVSLVVVSPRHEQQKTLRALREYEDVQHYVPNEDSKKTERPESVQAIISRIVPHQFGEPAHCDGEWNGESCNEMLSMEPWPH
jgi:hypothetical protein